MTAMSATADKITVQPQEEWLPQASSRLLRGAGQGYYKERVWT
jgi:hypothetical protein